MENVNINDERRPKIVKKTEFLIAFSCQTGDNWQSKTLVVAISEPCSSIVRQEFLIAAYPVWKRILLKQEHEKCKLFLVALVSDNVFAMYSVGIYSINTSHRGQSKTIITIDECRSKIIRNRVFYCRLSPYCKLFLVALVSECFGDKWQSRTLFPAICDGRSSIFQSVFYCPLSDMIKARILC